MTLPPASALIAQRMSMVAVTGITPRQPQLRCSQSGSSDEVRFDAADQRRVPPLAEALKYPLHGIHEEQPACQPT